VIFYKEKKQSIIKKMTEKLIRMEGFLKRITPEKMQNVIYLTLVKEYWKANYFQLKDYGPITYVFWMKTEVPHLMEDLVVYFEINKSELIPHLIHNQNPPLDLQQSLIFIGTPSQFSSIEKMETVKIVKNISPLQLQNFANILGNIFQLLGQVSKRMDEGFKGSLNSQVSVKLQEQSRFYQKEKLNIGSENPSFEEKTSSSDILRIEIPILGFGQTAMPSQKYATPKDTIVYSDEPYDFSINPPNILAKFDFEKKIQKSLKVSDWLLQNDISELPIPSLNTFTHYFRSFIKIIQLEPGFSKNITLKDLINLAKSMITLLNPELARKYPEKSWKNSLFMLQSHEIINPKIDPPHLTEKGLILREILLLGQEINMEFISQLAPPMVNSLVMINLNDFDPISMEFGDTRKPQRNYGATRSAPYSSSSSSSPPPKGLCKWLMCIVFVILALVAAG
jgi:hypothetical protein